MPETARAMLRPEVAEESAGMDDRDADEAAILAMLRAETEAWLQRDFEALASHWVQSPQAQRMYASASFGVRVVEGWDAIGAGLGNLMARFPRKYRFEGNVRWENVNVVIDGTMAWVSYDQIGTNAADDFPLEGASRILKIAHRIDGAWKLGCTVMMKRAVDQASCPLIEVDAEARVLWMNPQARDRMRGHPGLVLAAGRLRARRRERDPALRDAVRWASRELQSLLPLTWAAKQACAVPLGEDDGGVPHFCWVLLEDGKALVAFDDADTVARRIAGARELYGLSPAQVRLARLIVDGQDLAAAADLLGVSVNTLRTQLQRIFDKTGVRSQAALIRKLLSAEPPIR
jgi:DNA-binding CsgD family transcriptional regulator/PAS domain-containing protein